MLGEGVPHAPHPGCWHTDGVCIRARTDADIVTLDGADDGFSHSIALWTFDRRGSRFEADVASEAACLAGEVTAGTATRW